VQRALRDGIERGYEGALPEAPPGCECYSIVAQGQVVGLLAFVRDTPGDGEVTFWAVAIVPEHRAHAYGARALLAAERRLHREGTRAFYMRVPRGNGRGLYFALRCGYAPAIAPAEDGATWLRRNLTPEGRSAVGRETARRPRRRAARESISGN